MLDCGYKIWLWQGWWPETESGSDGYADGSVRWHAERRASMQTAVDYWKLTKSGKLNAELVWAGHETSEFKSLFYNWNEEENVSELNKSVIILFLLPLRVFPNTFFLV